MDQLGDCQFDRTKDKLTIVVPGNKEHECDGVRRRLEAPCLLRDVEGDFAVQVRVGGNFQHANPTGERAFQRAGLLVTDGKNFARVERAAFTGTIMASCDIFAEIDEPVFQGAAVGTGGPLADPGYLRIERQGDSFRLLFSENGHTWRHAYDPWSIKWPYEVQMPRKVKVGVVAEASSAGGVFTVEFSQFHLTQPPHRVSIAGWDLDDEVDQTDAQPGPR
jgi:regulation of enolase protein 1 (concanavalin A-like superfamily)